MMGIAFKLVHKVFLDSFSSYFSFKAGSLCYSGKTGPKLFFPFKIIDFFKSAIWYARLEKVLPFPKSMVGNISLKILLRFPINSS